MIDFKKLSAAAILVSLISSGAAMPAYAGGPSDSDDSDSEDTGFPRVKKNKSPATQPNAGDQTPIQGNTPALPLAPLPQDDAIGRIPSPQAPQALPAEGESNPLTSLQNLSLTKVTKEEDNEEEKLLKRLDEIRMEKLRKGAEDKRLLEEEAARQKKLRDEEAEKAKQATEEMERLRLQIQEAEKARLEAEAERVKQEALLEAQKREEEEKKFRLAREAEAAEHARIVAQKKVRIEQIRLSQESKGTKKKKKKKKDIFRNFKDKGNHSLQHRAEEEENYKIFGIRDINRHIWAKYQNGSLKIE